MLSGLKVVCAAPPFSIGNYERDPCPTACVFAMSTFTFQPRWKEELVCTARGGSFVLELTMGVLGAYLPTEEAWKRKAPEWARDLWSVLKAELESWCQSNNTKFVIDENAAIY
jgi:hypothetical protein